MVALILYNILLVLLSPLLCLYALWHMIGSGKSRRGLAERLGLLPTQKCAGDTPCLWLHAVSVGETFAARPIWQALLAALPGWRLLHSTTTDTGQAQAVKSVGAHGQTCFFPIDLLPCVWLALARARPAFIVLVETELWPNFLAIARLRRIPVMLVNGRISDRSLRRALRLAPLYRWMTGNVDRFCMQSDEDAARIIRLGADPARVMVMGNSKFDQVLTHVPLDEQAQLRDALGLRHDEPLLLAGCTHPGEEETVLRAFRQVKAAVPAARLLLVPRHIQRAQEVEAMAVAHGFAAVRKTRLAQASPPPDAVIILDTIGELARAYALCRAAFVGGSLVPVGGHNVLEPVALGKPALFGPYTSNFRDIVQLVQDAGVGMPITGADDLAAHWQTFLTDPARCAEIAARVETILAHRGASARCAAEAQRLAAPACPEATS